MKPLARKIDIHLHAALRQDADLFIDSSRIFDLLVYTI